MKKFKEGDRVTLRFNGQHSREESNWSLADALSFGDELTVRLVSNDGWLKFEGKTYWHVPDKYELVVDCFIIILRRPSDRKSIEKFLKSEGFVWNDSAIDNDNKDYSRVIVGHLKGYNKGELLFNAAVSFDDSVEYAIKNTEQAYWKYSSFAIIRTKPSVKQAINEIKKYI